ncbi:MAG: transposase [uncultured archaeon A07HR60]|nr:MAG: transposase [uncultured archaeon A07HR60]
MLEYSCDRDGTHFVTVAPRETIKECVSYVVATDNPLWVREHSCPSCGFEADRDANASWNILSGGLEDGGVVHSEPTPVETALPPDTDSVSAKRVVETGSPTLTKRTAQAVSE